jgi:hypothetical protein
MIMQGKFHPTHFHCNTSFRTELLRGGDFGMDHDSDTGVGQ